MSKPLSPKQQVFVNEYLVTSNITQAAAKAGYAHPHVQGSRLLNNVSVKAAIDKALAEVAAAGKVDAEYVIRGLKREAEYFGEGSSHSARVSAMSWLGKHLAIFKENLNVLGSLGLNVNDLTERFRAEFGGEVSRLSAALAGKNGHANGSVGTGDNGQTS